MRFDPQSNFVAETESPEATPPAAPTPEPASTGSTASSTVRNAAVPGLLLLMVGCLGAAVAYWLDRSVPVRSAEASVPVVEFHRATDEAGPAGTDDVEPSDAEPAEPAEPGGTLEPMKITPPDGVASDEPTLAELLDRHDMEYKVGRRLMAVGRHAEAVKHFRAALESRDDQAQTHYQLGLAYVMIGDREGARRSVRHLKRLDPSLASLLHGLVR